jgi:protein-S-isoprenylcysteine O-methyltransferase Ste14
MGFDDGVRVFLAFYFAFVGIHYLARLIGLRQRTGIRHAHPGHADAANRLHQQVFRLFRGLILAVCVLRVPYPGLDHWLMPFPALQTPAIIGTGVVLMLAALAWADYVHSYMNADWRSGLNDDPKGQLITTGPFALSRNPIFIGILAGQLGFFLALPSVFTLVCLLLGGTIIRRQIEVEERRMAGLPDFAGYDAYRATTPRWITLESLARFRQAPRGSAIESAPTSALDLSGR